MLSNSVHQALAALEATVAALGAADWEDLPVRERLKALQQWETSARVQRARSCGVARGLDRCDELGTMGAKVIADVLRITPRESRRRLRDAELVSARRTLTGQSLPPLLPATAKAWDSGLLDTEHLRVIERFHRELPEDLHPAEVETAEAFLAEKAAELRPDQPEVLADRLALTLIPDGRFSDDDRARKRRFTWCGRQRLDGMSIGKLVASPELRATIDALLAKFAAPGMCNPDDQSPIVNTEPTDESAQRDKPSCAQRQHDALAALLRSQLGNPKLGQHNGLPVTIIATTTVEQLCARTGHAVTASGTLLPMRDLIRMASHSWHYLAVFAQHSQQPVYLGRSKRIASADQRIALHAKDSSSCALLVTTERTAHHDHYRTHYLARVRRPVDRRAGQPYRQHSACWRCRMTAVTWRDFAERLTPAQVAEMEHCEREQIPPGIYSPHRAINVAQSFIRSNEAQVRFADVPVPADALDVPSPWVDYDDTRWWRSYTAHRTALDFSQPDYPGHDGMVVIEIVGNQYSDGAVEHNIHVDGRDAFDELDASQAREVAAALIAVADTLDRLADADAAQP